MHSVWCLVGIMRSDDLKLLFKNAAFKPEDIKTYIIDLLNKFEVALLWDEKSLLIPSLLPTEENVRMGLPQTDVRVGTPAHLTKCCMETADSRPPHPAIQTKTPHLTATCLNHATSYPTPLPHYIAIPPHSNPNQPPY